MDFFDVVKARHSIRAYQARDVAQDDLAAILGCANTAPSAGNLQPYEIVVVRDLQARQALARAAKGQSFLAQAPVVLVFLQHPARSAATYGSRGAELYCVQDTAIACAYAQLAATRLGLATCWVGAFHPEPVARLLGAPPGLIPVALVSLGYAAERPVPARRRRLDDLVHNETFRPEKKGVTS